MPTASVEMTVLITAISLADLGGSSLYVRDLARRLLDIGHRPVVYTPDPGPLADELGAATIPVLTSLRDMVGVPDVIHGNHTVETVEAALRFPGVPTVFVAHGWDAWMAEPPSLSSVTHFVGVTRACRDRIVFHHSRPEEQCRIVPNGVDTDRFARRSEPLPGTPHRALVFSNNATVGGYLDQVRAACQARDIALDVIGTGVGNPEAHPERVLPGYDLVFARGRCALEAISCGAAVVLVDSEGLGPMVTSTNIDALHLDGMGRRALSAPHDADQIGERIDQYDAADAARVVDHVRANTSLAAMTDQLLAIYREARQMHATLEVDPEADLAWLLDYLPTLSRLGHERDAMMLSRHQLRLHRDLVLERLQRAEEALARDGEGDEVTRLRDEVAALGAQLDALRSTRWFRARAGLSRVPGVRRVAGRIRS